MGLLLYLILAGGEKGMAQSIERTGVFSASGCGDIGATTYLFSIGESVVGTYNTTLPSTTLGFQQPIDQSLLPIFDLNFEVVYNGGGMILNWMINEIEDPGTFQVLRSINGQDFEDIVSFRSPNNLSSFSWTDKRLPDAQEVFYQIEWLLPSGQIIRSQVVQIQLSTASKSLRLYPNPTRDLLTIELPREDDLMAQVKVWDLQGRLVKEVESDRSRFILDLANLASGTYQVMVQSATKRWMEKVVVE